MVATIFSAKRIRDLLMKVLSLRRRDSSTRVPGILRVASYFVRVLIIGHFLTSNLKAHTPNEPLAGTKTPTKMSIRIRLLEITFSLEPRS
jgi:hypothetical protein